MPPIVRGQGGRGKLILQSAAVCILMLCILSTQRIMSGTWAQTAFSSHNVVVAPTNSYCTVAPFVFNSIDGLLKQWPNTLAPNGHTIVAGTIPPSTVLYHAKHGMGAPDKPTFFAFDAEMSMGIYGGFGQSEMHVVATTRPLSIIYFDGQSATLTPGGTLDSQMAVLQGNIPLYPSYDLVYDDDQRAVDLCHLVADLGIDGVVRMNAGFEVLICDYTTSAIEEIFVTNITVPGNLENDKNKSLPQDPNRQPPRGFGNIFSEQGSYEWLRSGTWHYGANGGDGESRVQLDVCRGLSFYDPSLASLANSHHGGIVGNQSFENGWGLRRGHRLLDIDASDVEKIRTWLQDLSSPPNDTLKCSGVDWRALITTIRAQHGTRATEIAATFEWEKNTEDDQNAIITKIHELSHAILAPYLEYRVSSPRESDSSSKNQTIARCSSVYTAAIKPESLSRFEVLLYKSLDVVMSKLCSWEWDLFEWSEERTSKYLSVEDSGSPHNEIDAQHKHTLEVLSWIGWDGATMCDYQCAATELCALPMWPVVYAPGLPQGGIYAGSNPVLSDEETRDFWRPKCVGRDDFDRGGGRGREPIHQFPDVPPY